MMAFPDGFHYHRKVCGWKESSFLVCVAPVVHALQQAVCASLREGRTNKTKPTAHFVRQKLIGYLRAVESLPVCSSLIALYAVRTNVIFYQVS